MIQWSNFGKDSVFFFFFYNTSVKNCEMLFKSDAMRNERESEKQSDWVKRYKVERYIKRIQSNVRKFIEYKWEVKKRKWRKLGIKVKIRRRKRRGITKIAELINNNGVLIINWKIELLLSHYHWRHSLLSYLSLNWIISRLEHLTVQVN